MSEFGDYRVVEMPTDRELEELSSAVEDWKDQPVRLILHLRNQATGLILVFLGKKGQELSPDVRRLFLPELIRRYRAQQGGGGEEEEQRKMTGEEKLMLVEELRTPRNLDILDASTRQTIKDLSNKVIEDLFSNREELSEIQLFHLWKWLVPPDLSLQAKEIFQLLYQKHLNLLHETQEQQYHLGLSRFGLCFSCFDPKSDPQSLSSQ